MLSHTGVIPAKAGIQRKVIDFRQLSWVPVFAGMTLRVVLGSVNKIWESLLSCHARARSPWLAKQGIGLLDPSIWISMRSSDQQKPLFFFEKQAFSSPRMTPRAGMFKSCSQNLDLSIYSRNTLLYKRKSVYTKLPNTRKATLWWRRARRRGPAKSKVKIPRET